MVRNAERNVVLREDSEDFGRVPTGVPELKDIAMVRREHADEILQPIWIGREIWRQLKQDRSRLGA